MPKETMSPVERWLAVLKRRKPDRVPMDYQATPEADEKLLKYLRCGGREEMYRRLHIDKPVPVGGKYVGPEPAPGMDVFGCRYQEIDYGTGKYSECVHNPLAQYKSVGEIERNYRWPTADHWDYSEVPERVKGKEHLPIIGGGSEPFLTYKYLRGDVQAFVDLVENPEIVRYCLGKLFDLSYENTRRLYEKIPGKVLLSYIAEDMGGQEDLMISPAQIEEFLIPGMKRMIDLAHQAGVYVIHHNDGAVRKIIPTMIGAGIDILNPIQWRCKSMERHLLKRDFGLKLIFHGGVDNQQTLPFGSVKDVREEVIANLKVLGSGGGYILAPCHNIQAVGPPENTALMYETGYEYGWM